MTPYFNKMQEQLWKEKENYRKKIERIKQGKKSPDDGKNQKLGQTRYIP